MPISDQSQACDLTSNQSSEATDHSDTLQPTQSVRDDRSETDHVSATGNNKKQRIKRDNIADIYPLSALQQGMLFHSLLHEDSGVYIMQDRYRIKGKIDVLAFEKAWQHVVDTHAALRTAFSWKSQKQPLQIVYKSVATPLRIINICDKSDEQQEQYIEELLQREQRSGFNMARPPLIRFRLVQRGEHDYELVRSFHHILMDAWCISLVLVDFLKIYDALIKGEQPVLTPPRPFRDYIAWLQQQDNNAAKIFWQQRLSGLCTCTPIAVEQQARKNQYDQAVRVDESQILLSRTQTQQLHAFCRQHSLTPNTFFQGVWALLLNRYSGHDDVLFGVTVSGRPPTLTGIETMIGLFINSLPLRVSLPRNTTVIEWLTGIQQDNLAMREYEHSSLVDIQGWSNFARGETLFDTLLVYENAPFDRLITDGEFSFEWQGMKHGVHTHYGLTVVIMPHEQMELKISYDYARFERTVIDAMLLHMRQLAMAMIAHADALLHTIDLLSKDERHQLLHTFNHNHHDFPLEHAYPVLFEHQVKHHAQQIVASCQGQSLSFEQLHQRSNRLGHAIAHSVKHTQEEFVVAVFAERNLSLLTAIIATFKAGGAYLPLTPGLPDARLQELLALSKAPVMVADRSCYSRAQTIALQHHCELLAIEDYTLDGVIDSLAVHVSPQRLAYVLFTSGSTGTPKGVMVEQRGMLNNIFGKQPADCSLGLSQHDIIAQTASQAFDISVWQLLAAPLIGARVEILPDAIAHDPVALLNAIVEHNITVLEAVPVMIRALLDVATAQQSLGSLRWLMATGEALSPALANEWLKRFPDVPIMNAYGPAECSDDVAFHGVYNADVDINKPLPVGKATANNQLYILDNYLRPQPVGVPGEIGISGVGVGRGYWRDQARTREVFIDHPFEPGARFYRSGDLGRWLPDGSIEYLGRKDFQVKIRGHRIEPGEIENRLQALPQVHSAAVVAPLDHFGERQLVAYWTARDTDNTADNDTDNSNSKASEPADSEALATALAAQLPEYMVPGRIIRLDTLPLSGNGKIDRKALEARNISPANVEPVAPRTETQATLVTIWKKVLQRETVGVEDSFFALGGHSLLATRVMAHIRDTFQCELPLRTLFEQNTISKLAALIDNGNTDTENALPAPGKQPRPGKLPLSYAQHRLWFLDQLEPDSAQYNTAFALRIYGPLDTTGFAADLDTLVARHALLRSRILLEDGTPELVINEQQTNPLHLITVPQAQWPLLIETQLPETARRVFSLDNEAPIRIYLYRHETRDEAIFLCVQHHVVTDGCSIYNLLTELAEIRLARRENRRPLLPALPIDYVDYTLWQRRPELQALFDRQMAYWEDTLGHGAYALTLPTDHARSQPTSEPDYRSGECRITLERGLTAAIRQYAAQRSVTAFTVMMASLHLLLGRYSQQRIIRVGTPVAGRSQPQTHAVVGCFVNTLVIQSELTPRMCFNNLVDQLEKKLIEAQANQDVPFEQVVEHLSHNRDLSLSPLFQVLFTMHQHRLKQLDWGDNQVEEVIVESRTTAFDLSADVFDDEQDLVLLLNYRCSLFKQATIQRWTHDWVELLETVTANPAQPLDLGELAAGNKHATNSQTTPVQQTLHTQRATPARADTERQLAGIWCEVLQRETVGVQDNFFELGGHSLLITRVIAKVREHFSVELRLRSLFDYPTIAAMAGQIDNAAYQQQHALSDIPVPERLPLSYAQQRLWFLSQLEPQSSQYNMPFGIRFHGKLNIPALANAFDTVVSRHEILSSRVCNTGDEPQLIQHAERARLKVQSVAASQWHNKLQQLIQCESEQAFDLATDAPIRARLITQQEAPDTAVFLLTLHHCVADDWSIDILLDELASAYQSHCQQLPVNLPTLTAQYLHYSLWQRLPEHQQRFEKELTYWTDTLGEGDYRLALAQDNLQTTSDGNACHYYDVTLPDALHQHIQEYCRQQGVTAFIMHMTALHLLLHRYSGQQDIRVGMPVSGRHHPDTHRMIGCFINTLVIRSDKTADNTLTFNELVQHIAQRVIEAQEHQDIPFERVVNKLVKDRDLQRSPLFQVMLSMEHAQLKQQNWPGLTLEEIDVPAIDAQFDLSFDLNDNGNRTLLRTSYRSHQFSHARIKRLLQHWFHLLRQGLNAPHTAIGDFSLVTPAEQTQIDAFNHTAHPFPLHLNFAGLLQHQATTHPNKIVAHSPGQALTFSELVHRSHCLASSFEQHGLFEVKTPVVAIFGERGLPFLCALVATMRSGVAYLPLDPNLPDARLTELLTLAQVPLLVTTVACHERGKKLADAQNGQMIVVEERWLVDNPAPLTHCGTPDSLAYVLFTSGSTGTPKGVMVEQKSMLNNIFGKQPTDTSLGLSEHDVIAQTASQAFDISVWQFLAAPVIGARVEILPDCIAHDPVRLLAAIDKYNITILEAVPAVIRALLDVAGSNITLPTLRWLVATGEALPATLANDWLQRFPDIALMNAYGPAECADDVAFHAIDTPLNPSQPVPIGRPTANNELLILDDAGRLLPPGIVGEIGICGVGVGRGYWKDKTRTTESFISHPHNANKRLYRSGDLGRWCEDGTIEYCGRKDFQIKVRGHRIEPQEIAARLEQHPAVKTAAVVAPENALGENQLVAYWVRHEGTADKHESTANEYESTANEYESTAGEHESTADEHALNRWLTSQLPAYMIPGLLRELPQIPLNHNGKIDRQALIDLPLQQCQHERRAPASPREKQLAQMWRMLLTNPEQTTTAQTINADDNFFALGGHSLLATRLLAHIQEQWNVTLPLRDIFEHATLEALATRIDKHLLCGDTHQDNHRTIKPTDITRPDVLPLSYEQRRLWLLDQLEPGSNRYHVPFALALKGSLNIAALQQAFEQLALRHEILRSRIQAENDTPYLIIVDEAPALQITCLTNSDWQAQIIAALQTQACNPFDLSYESPLRAHLLQREDHKEAVLIITQHHVITDDWSIQIMLDELSQYYSAALEQRPASLTPLSAQYVDYSLWQQAFLQQSLFDKQLAYWKNTLGEEPYVLNLPTTHTTTAPGTLPAGETQITLPGTLVTALRDYAGQQNTTVFVVLMASLHILLARYCNQADVRVGTPVTGRRQQHTQTMLGCFVNTLVISSQVNTSGTFNQQVQQVHQKVLAAQENQDVPFERVVDALVKERDFDRSPLFQVMLSMENTQLNSDRWPGLDLREIPMPATAAQFAQNWEVYDDGQSIAIKLYYDQCLFAKSTIVPWLTHLQQALLNALQHPDSALATLDWLNEAERTQLLDAFNQSQHPFALTHSYPDHFARQVQRYSTRPLAHCGTHSLTYAEIDQRSNRLVNAMIRPLRHQCQGKIVALFGTRDLALLTGIIATLKAGAAYMPLAPELPDGRLAQLLSLGGAQLLLASQSCRNRAQQLASARGCQLIIIEDTWLSGEEFLPAKRCTADDLAYVLFTSGSTGTPKGVMIEHKGMLNNIFGKQPDVGLCENDIIAQTASQAFDTSVWQFLAAAVVGAQVRIIPDSIAHDPSQLLTAIDDYGITLLEAVPAIIQGLLDSADVNDTHLTSLRWLLATGEALPPALANRWLQRFPSIALINIYGPAECSDDVAVHVITRAGLDTQRPVPIGRPTANNKLYILDDHLRPQPIGVPGEICIAGVGVGRGYWRDQTRTHQVFIDHPFEPGARFYRSGDLGRWLPDGSIEYLGRKDFQIKIRGHRIEPGEIENCLTNLPDVKAAVVIAHRNERAVNQLVAYWVANADNICADTLREKLQQQLPAYMVPDLFMALKALPLNANGKVDRKALPTPKTHTGTNVTATGSVEIVLCELIQSLLGLDKVWANDNFFALGGDSILALQLISRARQAGITLTPRLIFQQRSISDLARAAKEQALTDAEQGVLTGDVPLMPVQHWFFARQFEHVNHWNQALLCRYQGQLDATLTEQVLKHLVTYHDALRLRFCPAHGRWRQYYGDVHNALRFITLDNIATHQMAHALSPLAETLDIQNGPISQAALLTLDNGEQRLYWVIHHLVIDTVSWNILQDDFVTLYQQISNAKPLQLPPKTHSWRQWVQHWQSPAQLTKLARQRSWWQQQDIDFRLPVANPDAPATVSTAITLVATLDKARTQQFLKHAQNAYRTRPEEMLLSALAITLSQWSGQSAVRVAMEHHGRTDLGSEQLDISRTVGWFTAIYPLKLDVPQTENPGQQLCAIKEQLRAVPDNGVAYGALQYLCNNDQALNHCHRSPVSFEYFGIVQPDSTDDPLQHSDEPQPLERGAGNHCEYELDVTTQIADGCLSLEWTYASLRDKQHTQQAHLDHFVDTLQSLIDHCLSPEAGQLTPSDFPMAKNLDQNALNSLLQRFGSAAQDTTRKES